MKTETKKELFDVVSVVGSMVILIAISFYAVDYAENSVHKYFSDKCNSRQPLMCVFPD